MVSICIGGSRGRFVVIEEIGFGVLVSVSKGFWFWSRC